MKLSKFLLSTLVSLTSFAAASDEASDVIDLSGETLEGFNKFIEDHPLVLAKFFTTWCGHCKSLAPEYKLAATDLKEKDITLVEIDCERNQPLCAEHKVQGYPTLYVFKSLDSKSQYMGGRTADAIVQYMQKELLPPLQEVTPKSLESFKALGPVGVVAFYDDEESTATYTTLSDALHHDYTMGYSNDLKFAKSLGVSAFPAMVVFSAGVEEPVIYEAKTAGEDFEFTKEKLAVNIVRASIAPGGEIGPDTFRAYMSAELPMAYFFYETEEQRNKFREALLPLAKKVKSKLNIGFIDAVKFGSHAVNINLEEKFPSFAIHNMKSNRKFPFPQDKDLTTEDLIAWVQDWVEGKIIAKVKSDPIPESQDGPVYTVVGHNYESIVMDNDKDVLIEFYAPWCGHCKKLAPIYDELGALYFNHPEFKDKVAIAQVDHTANEIDIDIQGYPTLMLFPAGKKDSPITFESARTLEALNDFVRDSGTHKIDGIAGKNATPPKVKKAKKSKKSKKAKKAKKADGASKDEL